MPGGEKACFSAWPLPDHSPPFLGWKSTLPVRLGSAAPLQGRILYLYLRNRGERAVWAFTGIFQFLQCYKPNFP
jgi:hypothetical protein